MMMMSLSLPYPPRRAKRRLEEKLRNEERCKLVTTRISFLLLPTPRREKSGKRGLVVPKVGLENQIISIYVLQAIRVGPTIMKMRLKHVQQ